ncbi:hypothetical protein AAF712_000505 [Marasmius tenuissimus]|uniref:Uncharacterized protein n=1 Tax=Marasmius tenuissimus TaxID=585030 RepID=A0ABR3AHA3_9AGAR|nr:hypothetical protein PM082_001348 [Marasmius tenuissimus]
MSSILTTFPVNSTALASRNAKDHLLCVNTLMKNCIIRALARILEIAPTMKERGEFHSFMDYIGIVCEVLELHLKGEYRAMPSANKRSINQSQETKCSSPRLLLVKESNWLTYWELRVPGSFGLEYLVAVTRVSSTAMGSMVDQLAAVHAGASRCTLGNEELQKMINVNIAWIGNNSDPAVVLPFILAHHERSAAPQWPVIAAEVSEKLPLIVGGWAKCWKLAPFDPLTGSKNPAVSEF